MSHFDSEVTLNDQLLEYHAKSSTIQPAEIDRVSELLFVTDLCSYIFIYVVIIPVFSLIYIRTNQSFIYCNVMSCNVI